MARDLTSGQIASLEAGAVRLNYAVSLTFYDTTTATETAMHLWTGIGDLVSNSITYTGVGDFLSVSGHEETSDFKANGITLKLSGLTTNLTALGLGKAYIGRSAVVYLQTDGSTDLIEVFAGKMDEITFNDDAETTTVEVSIEHVLIDLDRTNPFRYTAQSHELIYSGETFFSYTQDLQDQEVEWGPN